MAILLISFFVIALAVLGMASGLVLRGRPLRQSCAGVVGLETREGICPGCAGGDVEARVRKREAA